MQTETNSWSLRLATRLEAGKKKKRRKCPELDLQGACMEWLGKAYPKAWEVTFAIPNEGATSWIRGKKQRLAGIKAGVP